MADIFGELVLVAVALVAILVGTQAIRDIAKGEAQSLSRMSKRVYFRSEQPLGFWMTVATEIGWLLLGFFLLTLTLGGLFGLL
jgi:hypothetical protein